MNSDCCILDCMFEHHFSVNVKLEEHNVLSHTVDADEDRGELLLCLGKRFVLVQMYFYQIKRIR